MPIFVYYPDGYLGLVKYYAKSELPDSNNEYEIQWLADYCPNIIYFFADISAI